MISRRRARLGRGLLLAAALAAAGCERLTATREPTELVFAPLLEPGAAPTPALLEEIRSGLEQQLRHERHRAEVAVVGERIRVVLAPGVPQRTLARLRTDLCLARRFGIHELDAAAVRALAPGLPPQAQLLDRYEEPSIGAPDEAAARRILDHLRPRLPPGRIAGALPPGATGDPWEILVLAPAAVDGRMVLHAEAGRNEPYPQQPVIQIELDESGARTLAELSRRCLHRRLALVVGGRVRMAPVVQSEIPGGRVQITLGQLGGKEAFADAKRLADELAHGAPIPVPLRLVSERTLP